MIKKRLEEKSLLIYSVGLKEVNEFRLEYFVCPCSTVKVILDETATGDNPISKHRWQREGLYLFNKGPPKTGFEPAMNEWKSEIYPRCHRTCE